MDYLNFTHYDRIKGRTLSFLPHLNAPTDKFKNFLLYPYPISYKINSRGFRDSEWPSDLSNVVWCLGDSVTLGHNIPFEHTWPSILQTKTNIRCVNLGIVGASNELLTKMTLQILREYSPKNIVIMWVFFTRRHKDPWNFIDFESLDDDVNLKNFIECYHKVNNSDFSCNIINLLMTDQPKTLLPQSISQNIFHTNKVDYGRDLFHFDYKTAEIYVEHILSKLI